MDTVAVVGIRFDRRVTAALMDILGPDGPLGGVTAFVHEVRPRLDLELRSVQGPRCHASLYMGLTSVLDVREQQGVFWLAVHDRHRSAGSFDVAWASGQPAEDWWPAVGAVDLYLRRIVADGAVDPRWWRAEGQVQNVMCAGSHSQYGVVQREAVVWSDGGPSVADVVTELSDKLWALVRAAQCTEAWWPGVRDRGTRPAMGEEADALAVGADGRLLCIEVKDASNLKGIVWAPAQVALYAELFARWLTEDPDAVTALRGMAAQRVELGLLEGGWAQRVPEAPRVVPVVAIGAGRRSGEALPRLASLWKSISEFGVHPLVDPLEVWLLDPSGEPELIWVPADGSEPPAGPGVVVPASGASEGPPLEDVLADGGLDLPAPPGWFKSHALASQIDWAARHGLVTSAGQAGAAGHLLAPELRSFNLVEAARQKALDRFAAADVRWHGDEGGPTTNVLSSQVQCLNALAPHVDDPATLGAWLRGCGLDVETVLAFGASTDSPYDATDYVVFEWQGLVDHLGEWHGASPTRGALATSVDAAIRYKTGSGAVEMALVEWKYTESYPYGGRLGGTAASHSRRLARYRSLVEDPDGPIQLTGGVDYEDLFAEPIYQLMRLQLLAWRIEEVGELDVSRAVVVYATPHHNQDLLQRSLGAPRMASLASAHGGLLGGWRSLLRRADRFVVTDTADLVRAGGLVVEDFRERYRHLLDEPPAVPSAPAPPHPQPSSGLPGRLTGEELRALYDDEDTADVWVGRRGGLTGTELADDIASDAWRARTYRVARGPQAPNARWFRLDDFLGLVAAARRQERSAAGWEVQGVVAVDSAAVAIAAAEAARRLDPVSDFDDVDNVAVLVTMADVDLPVEARRSGDAIIEVRIDVVDDVDDLPGVWQPLKTITVAAGGAIAYDPFRDIASRAVPIAVPAGLWRAEVFESGGDLLALRLIPA